MEITQLKFTGNLLLDDATGNWSVEESSGPVYVGPPSEAIDSAWDTLLDGMYGKGTVAEGFKQVSVGC